MRIHVLPWQDVAVIVGALDDDRVAAIIASGATIEDIRQAKALADGIDRDQAVAGVVAKVYDILTADEARWRER